MQFSLTAFPVLLSSPSRRSWSCSVHPHDVPGLPLFTLMAFLVLFSSPSRRSMSCLVHPQGVPSLAQFTLTAFLVLLSSPSRRSWSCSVHPYGVPGLALFTLTAFLVLLLSEFMRFSTFQFRTQVCLFLFDLRDINGGKLLLLLFLMMGLYCSYSTIILFPMKTSSGSLYVCLKCTLFIRLGLQLYYV